MIIPAKLAVGQVWWLKLNVHFEPAILFSKFSTKHEDMWVCFGLESQRKFHVSLLRWTAGYSTNLVGERIA